MYTVLLEEAEWPMLRNIRLQALRQDPDAFISTHERELRYSESEWRREFACGSWTILVNEDQRIRLLGATEDPDSSPDTCYLEYMWICANFVGRGTHSAW